MTTETPPNKKQVSVIPEVTRDASGKVERQRLVVVVDVVPVGEDYKLDVSIDAIPSAMLSEITRIQLPKLAL
jgi:hypothetical protein